MVRLDISVIKPIYRLSTFFGLTPSYNFKKRAPKKLSLWYSAGMLLLFIIVPAVSFRERFNSTYPFTPNVTDIILDSCLYITLSCTNLVNILHMRFGHSKTIVKILRRFSKLDCVLRIEDKRKIQRKIHAELIFFASTLIFVLLYNETFWDLAFGFEGNWPYFFANFQRFQLFITAMLIYNILKAFLHRFKHINSTLSEMKELQVFIFNNVHFSVYRKKPTIKDINEAHKTLLLMYKDFNAIFGTPIALLSANFIFGILHPINSAVLQLMHGNVITEVDIPNFTAHYIIITSIQAFNTVVLCVPIATTCHSVMEEAKRILEICRTLKHQLSTSKSDKDLSRDLQELTFIAQESSRKYPSFSAAGFYAINRKMLFTMFGGVTAYLIVFIQLNINFHISDANFTNSTI